MKSVHEKIKELRDKKGLTQEELGKLIGVSNQTISGWERGRTELDISKIEKLCRALDTNINELLELNNSTGVVPLHELQITDTDGVLQKYYKLDKYGKETVMMILDHELERVNDTAKSTYAYIYPLVDDVQTVEIDYYPQAAGMGKGQDVVPSFPEKLEVSTDKVPEYTDYVIRVTGDSMMPTYYPGDLLFIQRTDHLNSGDIGVFVLEGETMVKELGKGELISHNKKYEPITKAESCIIQGRVLGKYTK